MTLATNADLIFRPAGIDDLAMIMHIEEKAHDFPWSQTVMQQFLKKESCVWVLLNHQAMIGHAVIRVIAGEAELLTIAIDPKYQGNGLGRYLLQQVLQQMHEQKAQRFFLEVRESNQGALHLYQTFGFVEVGIREDYYPKLNGQRENALILALELASEW